MIDGSWLPIAAYLCCWSRIPQTCSVASLFCCWELSQCASPGGQRCFNQRRVPALWLLSCWPHPSMSIARLLGCFITVPLLSFVMQRYIRSTCYDCMNAYWMPQCLKVSINQRCCVLNRLLRCVCFNCTLRHIYYPAAAKFCFDWMPPIDSQTVVRSILFVKFSALSY